MMFDGYFTKFGGYFWKFGGYVQGTVTFGVDFSKFREYILKFQKYIPNLEQGPHLPFTLLSFEVSSTSKEVV